MKKCLLVMVILWGCFIVCASAQDPATLLQKVKQKIELVKDYVADGTMKTSVSFLKVPPAEVKVYFQRPDRLKINNEKGISLVPKGSISFSLSKLMNGHYNILDAGTELFHGNRVRILKLLPADEEGEIVLFTVYIEESSLLILNAKTTTRENGSYEVEMSYGKFASYALPDKVIFSFNTKDYNLPKGITFDYDDGTVKKSAVPGSSKGKIEIKYDSYLINKGIPAGIFP